MDDAILRFQSVATLKPEWIENRYYLALAYSKKDAKTLKPQIIEQLEAACALPATNLSDQKALADAQSMRKKY